MKLRTWEPDEEDELLKLYCEDNWSILEIAEYFGKNNRSIISKLVKLKVYRKPEPKAQKRSVKHMIQELEQLLDIQLDSVNIYKKQNLEALVDAVKLKVTKEQS
jgi:hypothetical protein